ncbi:MAG: hypothetical protein EON51_19035, partial [Acinetobacter sp.]
MENHLPIYRYFRNIYSNSYEITVGFASIVKLTAMKLSLSSLFILLLFSFQGNAQMPVLKIKTANTQQESVNLQKLNIDVQITGNIAKTVMTMTFYNNSNRVLEGELTFPMPEGVTISRYALDINGKMR